MKRSSVVLAWSCAVWMCTTLAPQAADVDQAARSTKVQSERATTIPLDASATPAAASAADPDDVFWTSPFDAANSVVYAFTVWDGKLVACGDFTSLGGSGGRIAVWDGATWSQPSFLPAMPGNGQTVYALTVWNSKLIAGGVFTVAGGVPGTSKVAACDGFMWSALGTGIQSGTGPNVLALTVFNGNLIAGGAFTSASGTPANNIASWNGVSWSALAAGVSGVNALTTYGGLLIAASASTAKAWNDTSWSTLGTGFNNTVRALVVYNNHLIAGGQFTTADGATVNGIASWDGNAWSALGTGMPGFPGIVSALAVHQGQLFAGGNFTAAGSDSANDVASWNGSSWSRLGSGVAGGLGSAVQALASYSNKLYVGGIFSSVGGKALSNIAEWTKSYPVCPVTLTGDVNNTGDRVTSDIIYLVNRVLKGGAALIPCQAVGDVNCDGSVATSDIIYLVNFVLKGGPAPCDVCTLIPGTWACP